MNIAEIQTRRDTNNGVASIGEILTALPGYQGDRLEEIEHLPTECQRVSYAAKIRSMSKQYDKNGSKAQGRRRRHGIVDILELFARNAPVSVGIPKIVWADLHAVCTLICLNDADWDSERGPLIAASNAKLQQKLGWTAARTNLARMAQWGMIVPYNLASNGKRYLGNRDRSNDDTASGWSLSPLLLLQDVLSNLAERECQIREQHVALPRHIIRTTATAYRIAKAFAHEEWAQKALAKLNAISTARIVFSRRTVSLQTIEVLRRLADAAYRLNIRLEERLSNDQTSLIAEKTSTRVPFQRHHQYNPNSTSVSVDGLAEGRSDEMISQFSNLERNERPVDSARSLRSTKTKEADDPFGIERSGFKWSETNALFPCIKGLIEFPQRPGLDSLHALARISQISQSTAARASGLLGTEAAILCALITAHHFHAGEIRKTPDAYMTGLIKCAARGELNIGHTLFGRREATFGRRSAEPEPRRQASH